MTESGSTRCVNVLGSQQESRSSKALSSDENRTGGNKDMLERTKLQSDSQLTVRNCIGPVQRITVSENGAPG